MNSRIRKNLIYAFLLEVLTLPLVILIFKFVEPRKIAGLLAGNWFLVLAIIVYLLIKDYPGRSYARWGLLAHVLLATLPLLILRLVFWNLEFSEISIFGISGTLIHRTSEKVFLLLVLGTVIDFFRLVRD